MSVRALQPLDPDKLLRRLVESIQRPRLALPAIILLVALLAFANLGAKSLWLDEGTTVSIARLGWHGLWQDAFSQGEANMSLYYVLLHLWLHLGDSEAVLRSLSALFAAVTIPVFYALAARHFGSGIALLATLLLGINASFIHYAQEARGYMLTVLLVTVSSYLFVRSVDQPKWRWWLGYAVVSGLAIYAHFFAALVVLAHLVALLLRDWRRLPHRVLFVAYGLIGLFGLPLFVFILTADRSRIDWIEPPTVVRIATVFAALSGATTGPYSYPELALLFSFLVAAMFALYAMVRAWRRRADRLWPQLFLLVWLLVPVSTSLAVSVVKPVFVSRYLLVVLPALVLLAALGLSRMQPRWSSILLSAVIVALSGYELARWHAEYDKEDWRSATAYVADRARPGDGIAFHAAYGVRTYNYYIYRFEARERAPDLVHPDGWEGRTYVPIDETLDPGRLPRALRGIADRYPRFWLVLREPGSDLSGGRDLEEALQIIGRNYREVECRTFVRVEVRLYERLRTRAAFRKPVVPRARSREIGNSELLRLDHVLPLPNEPNWHVGAGNSGRYEYAWRYLDET